MLGHLKATNGEKNYHARKNRKIRGRNASIRAKRLRTNLRPFLQRAQTKV